MDILSDAPNEADIPSWAYVSHFLLFPFFTCHLHVHGEYTDVSFVQSTGAALFLTSHL